MPIPTIGGMTLEQWQAEAVTLTAARDCALKSQDYSVGDGVINRRNRRPDLEQIQAALAEARRNVETLVQQTAGTRRVFNLRPL